MRSPPVGSHRPLQHVLRVVHAVPGAVQVPEVTQNPPSHRCEQHALAEVQVAPSGAQTAGWPFVQPDPASSSAPSVVDASLVDDRAPRSIASSPHALAQSADASANRQIAAVVRMSVERERRAASDVEAHGRKPQDHVWANRVTLRS